MNKIPLAGERPERKVEIEQKKDPYDLKDKREEFRASSQHKQIEQSILKSRRQWFFTKHRFLQPMQTDQDDVKDVQPLPSLQQVNKPQMQQRDKVVGEKLRVVIEKQKNKLVEKMFQNRQQRNQQIRDSQLIQRRQTLFQINQAPQLQDVQEQKIDVESIPKIEEQKPENLKRKAVVLEEEKVRKIRGVSIAPIIEKQPDLQRGRSLKRKADQMSSNLQQKNLALPKPIIVPMQQEEEKQQPVIQKVQQQATSLKRKISEILPQQIQQFRKPSALPQPQPQPLPQPKPQLPTVIKPEIQQVVQPKQSVQVVLPPQLPPQPQPPKIERGQPRKRKAQEISQNVQSKLSPPPPKREEQIKKNVSPPPPPKVVQQVQQVIKKDQQKPQQNQMMKRIAVEQPPPKPQGQNQREQSNRQQREERKDKPSDEKQERQSRSRFREEQRQRKPKEKQIVRPPGVYKFIQKPLVDQTIDRYSDNLRRAITVLAESSLPQIGGDIEALPDSVQYKRQYDRMKTTFDIVNEEGDYDQKLSMSVDEFKQRRNFLQQFEPEDVKADDFPSFVSVVNEFYNLRPGEEDEADYGKYIYERLENIVNTTEDRIIGFLQLFIEKSKLYKRQYYEPLDVSLDYFRIMTQGDNLRRTLARHPEKINLQLAEDNREDVKTLLNFSTLDVRVLYQEYLALTQPDTEYPTPISESNLHNAMVKSELFAKYIDKKSSLERFAGRLACSKHHAMIVMKVVYQFLEWFRVYSGFRREGRSTIYERIFYPQNFENASLLPRQGSTCQFSGVMIYFCFALAHNLSTIYNQKAKNRPKLQRMTENIPSLTKHVLDIGYTPNFIVENFKPIQNNVQFTAVSKARVLQALDISNIYNYSKYQMTEIYDNGPEGINIRAIKGLVELIYTYNETNPQSPAYHYISFVVRIPVREVLIQPDVHTKFRDFDADLEYANDRVTNINFMYKSGSIVITPQRARDLIDEMEENANIFADNMMTQICQIIVEMSQGIIEDYYTEDAMEFSLSEMQILEYKVFSLPLGSYQFNPQLQFNLGIYNVPWHKPPDPFGIAPGPQNKFAVVNEKYYKTLDDYPDYDEINCVMQVFCYIFIKVKVPGAAFDLSSLQLYQESLFFKRHSHILELCDLFATLHLFQQEITKKIRLIFVKTKVNFFTPGETDEFVIKEANSHVWLAPLSEKERNHYAFLQNVYSLRIKEQKRKPLESKELKKLLIFYDIETKSVSMTKRRSTSGRLVEGKRQEPCLLCFEMIQGEDESTSKEDFFFGERCCLDFTALLFDLYQKSFDEKGKQTREIQVFSHNGNNFDNVLLFPFLLKFFGEKVEYGGSTFSIKFLQIQNVIYFIDTCELIPGKLASLAEDFQVSDRKMKFDVKEITEENLKDEQFKKTLIEYCQMDVRVMRQIYFRFLNTLRQVRPQINSSDIKRTLPSTALHIFRKFFYPKNAPEIFGNQPNINGYQVQNFERRSYYGGLCQVWNYQPVETDACYYDFVSMYVSILSKEKYPLSQGVRQLFRVKITSADRVDPFCLYVLQSFKFKNDAKMPNLPVRDPSQDSSIYCLRYKADNNIPSLVFWGREIKLAFEKLGLEEIECTDKIVYNDKGNVFSEYMTEFFEIKKKHKDGPLRAIAKLFGNSLYGKLGQQPMRTKQIVALSTIQKSGYEKLTEHIPKRDAVCIALQKSHSDHLITSVRELDNEFAELEYAADETRTNYCGSLIRLASFTTMCGRCWLFDLLHSIGYENLYYCDTDSCVFKSGGLAGMNRNIGKERGDIAPQFDADVHILGGEFIAPKCYYLELSKPVKGKSEYIRCKGIIKPTVQALKELSATGQTKIAQEKWEKRYGGVEILNEIKKLIINPKRIVNVDKTTCPYECYTDFKKI